MSKLVKQEDSPTGLSGFISWHRLEQRLREVGEVGDDEKVLCFSPRESGLRFFVDKVKEDDDG